MVCALRCFAKRLRSEVRRRCGSWCWCGSRAPGVRHWGRPSRRLHNSFVWTLGERGHRCQCLGAGLRSGRVDTRDVVAVVAGRKAQSERAEDRKQRSFLHDVSFVYSLERLIGLATKIEAASISFRLALAIGRPNTAVDIQLIQLHQGMERVVGKIPGAGITGRRSKQKGRCRERGRVSIESAVLSTRAESCSVSAHQLMPSAS